MVQPVKLGLIGLGTVGSGTVNVIAKNGEEIARRAGRSIEVSHVAMRDTSKIRYCDVQAITVTDDPWNVVNDPEVDVVVELMGGTELAKELVVAAIAHGKHVVTANKALIALHGNEIFQQAYQKQVMVAFEAAVAGGIPIIKSIREGMGANQIEWLAGIINGTGNYILTEMAEKDRSFNDVLQEAQSLGYAEADPSFDVQGIDMAHKLTILASIAFGIPLQFDKVYTEGIEHITPLDMAYTREFGYRIKHLAIAKRVADKVQLRVHPTLIPENRLIANVNGVMNAVLVNANAVGPTLYYGAGAGADPTASAVVADVVDVVRLMTADPENRVPHLAFQPDAISDLPIADMDDVFGAYYLRLNVNDKAGALGAIINILAQQDISIEALIQKDHDQQANSVPVVILTHQVKEKAINTAIEQIEALADVNGAAVRIRVESLPGEK